MNSLNSRVPEKGRLEPAAHGALPGYLLQVGACSGGSASRPFRYTLRKLTAGGWGDRAGLFALGKALFLAKQKMKCVMFRGSRVLHFHRHEFSTTIPRIVYGTAAYLASSSLASLAKVFAPGTSAQQSRRRPPSRILLLPRRIVSGERANARSAGHKRAG